MARLATPLLCCVCFPQALWAFFPEYQHLSPEEKRELNSPRLIDSEYQSDKLTYELPILWNYHWLSQDKVLQYSAGSLGPTRFLTRGRLKLKEDLSESVYFQLSYLDFGDFETARKALIFEFGYRPLRWLNFSVYGQTESLKSQDDVGVSAEIYFSRNNYLRLFYTSVDFSLNKRNEETDFYQQDPAAMGVVWRFFESEQSEFIEVSLRKDRDSLHFFPDEGRAYAYGGDFVSASSRIKVSESFDYLQVRLHGRKSFEHDSLNTDRGVDRWENRNFDLLIQHANDLNLIDLYGVKAVYQQWNSVQGNVIHNHILPHFWMSVYQSNEKGWQHQWHTGYEVTWHRGQGKSALRGGRDGDNVLEHRWNVRYRLAVLAKAQLNVLLTFDLDEFGSGETWEGGSVQYRMNF